MSIDSKIIGNVDRIPFVTHQVAGDTFRINYKCRFSNEIHLDYRLLSSCIKSSHKLYTFITHNYQFSAYESPSYLTSKVSKDLLAHLIFYFAYKINKLNRQPRRQDPFLLRPPAISPITIAVVLLITA